jgi:hypothetical protein
VTGTAFTFGWMADDEQLDVRMERGSVQVSGPLTEGELALRSGQHLIVRVRQRETVIRDLENELVSDLPAPAVPQEPVTPQGTDEPPSVAHPRRAAPGGQAAGTSDWATLLARGDFETILEQAQRRGVDSCLAEGSVGDLAALADAARYERHTDLARRTLLVERKRFPLSGPARDAAFLLGRLEESASGTPQAIEWYNEYLTESPYGTYASEAFGRKMILIQKLHGDDAARTIAREYLGRFPAGTYAARARALAGP